MNQGTVDSYLNWIINDTVDRASDRQASIMANLRKQEMNEHLETFERRFNNNETLIKDLVQSFLLPNVQRSRLAKKVQIEQRRFQEAAKKSLHTTFTKTANKIYENKDWLLNINAIIYESRKGSIFILFYKSDININVE